MRESVRVCEGVCVRVGVRESVRVCVRESVRVRGCEVRVATVTFH